MTNLNAPATEHDQIGWRFDNTYARLPEILFAPAQPASVQAPRLVILNRRLASDLGLNFDSVPPDAAAALFAGQELPIGSQPIAQAYAGHQYGHFTMLGDGRAILLGEHRLPSGQIVDIQFKGSGQTPFSRRGDGRAALGPMLREYIISEAMYALGIPTTRSLAVVTTGEPVYRETTLQGAILTRVAASHLRFGTFQYVAARQDEPNLRLLADYAISRHYPDLVDSPNRYADFFRAVMNRQAALVAKWQLVGFIHGVLNTDNMAVSGETIDYGPCAFMNAYRLNTVFSSIDQGGRYAYGNQPNIIQWNLARFAESLLPLLSPDQEQGVAIATQMLNEYPALYEQNWLNGMRAKLGLTSAEADDRELAESLLNWMQNTKADFTNTFRDLSAEELPDDDRYADSDFQAWHSRWQHRLARENQPGSETRVAMRQVNPAVIPRNHRVEEALAAAQDHDDLSPVHRLLEAVANPYEDRAGLAMYREPPKDECGYRTFCGT